MFIFNQIKNKSMKFFRTTLFAAMVLVLPSTLLHPNPNPSKEAVMEFTDEIAPLVIRDTLPRVSHVIPEVSQDDISDSLYNEIIEHIKEYESFRDTIYIDTDGSPTIGYGHHLREGETYTKITEVEATKILKEDFKIRVEKAKKYYDLEGAKAYAIALFVYNCGSGTYANSSLKVAVDNGNPIDSIIIQYNKYKHKGVYYESDGLTERRHFELEIYNI